MGMPKLNGYHTQIAKVVFKSVKSKPKRAASIIERVILHNIKNFPAANDKEMQAHVFFVGKAMKADEFIMDFVAQVKKIKAPEITFKAQKGRYGTVSADLVEDFCAAERNVTEDKIGDACNNAARRQNDSGVKLLDSHRRYSAELKITGAGKRLYALNSESGPRYKFTVLGNHT